MRIDELHEHSAPSDSDLVPVLTAEGNQKKTKRFSLSILWNYIKNKIHIAGIGSANRGVYFNSNGEAVQMTYELNATVPSNAVFTDTKTNVVNNLNSSSTTDALSAAQGKALNSTKIGKDDGWVNMTSTLNCESGNDNEFWYVGNDRGQAGIGISSANNLGVCKRNPGLNSYWIVRKNVAQDIGDTTIMTYTQDMPLYNSSLPPTTDAEKQAFNDQVVNSERPVVFTTSNSQTEGNLGPYIYSSKSNFIGFGTNANHYAYVMGTSVFYSFGQEAKLGTAENLWGQIYSKKSTISTSDRNNKRDIMPIDETLEQIFLETPCYTYFYNDGDRRHIGTVSQDIEELLDKYQLSAKDFGAFCKDLKEYKTTVDSETGKKYVEKINYESGEEEYIYSFRYEEYIMLTVHMVQKLYDKIDKLEARIEELESKK